MDRRPAPQPRARACNSVNPHSQDEARIQAAWKGWASGVPHLRGCAEPGRVAGCPRSSRQAEAGQERTCHLAAMRHQPCYRGASRRDRLGSPQPPQRAECKPAHHYPRLSRGHRRQPAPGQTSSASHYICRRRRHGDRRCQLAVPGSVSAPRNKNSAGPIPFARRTHPAESVIPFNCGPRASRASYPARSSLTLSVNGGMTFL